MEDSEALAVALRALKQYANRENWNRDSRVQGSFADWWGPEGDGFEIAEKALAEIRGNVDCSGTPE